MKKFTLPAGTTNRHQWHKDAVRAIENITRTFNMMHQKFGVIGGEEHESLVSVLGFGVNTPKNPKAVEIFNALGDKFDWSITRGNAETIAQAFADALPEAKAGIPIEDNRRTPKEEREQIEESNLAAVKREKEQAIKASETDEIADKLRAQYPWAVGQDSFKTGSARAAANLKKELTSKFPGVKFAVTSDTFSMGDSVDVNYTDGPSLRTVEKIADKYQCGRFDPMIDLSSYDHSAYGNAVDAVLGRAKYVHANRHYSDDIVTQAQTAVCAAYGVEYSGPSTVFDQSSGDYHARTCQNRAWRILQGQDIPRGAAIESLDSNAKGDDSLFGLFVFDVPEVRAPASNGAYSIEEHTHTKRGFQMFIVIPTERVERAEFNRLRREAKALGGWYSRKWQSTPGGFAFKESETAERFAAEH